MDCTLHLIDEKQYREVKANHDSVQAMRNALA